MRGAIAIIPARGASRRIPKKNVRLFHGKPIIGYSIQAAIASGLFDSIVVSTDDTEIANIARAFGAETVTRSPMRAQDHVGTQEVALEVLSGPACAMEAQPDLACVIYATAPLMDPAYLIKARNLLRDNVDIPFAFSVGTEPLRDAGQFYFGRTKAFINQHPLISTESRMIPIAEERVCDINTLEDWARAVAMYDRLKERGKL